MPQRVVIILEAQTEEALQRIKQFTRGVNDSFGAIKAGEPALRGATLSVKNLTSAKVDAFAATQLWQSALVLLPGQLGSTASQVHTLASAPRGPGGLAGGLLAVAAAGVGLVKGLSSEIERLDPGSPPPGDSGTDLAAGILPRKPRQFEG